MSMSVPTFGLFHLRSPTPKCTRHNWYRVGTVSYPIERAERIWETKLMVPANYELRTVGRIDITDDLQMV